VPTSEYKQLRIYALYHIQL